MFPNVARTLRAMDQVYAASSVAKMAENITAVHRMAKQFEDIAAVSNFAKQAESITAFTKMAENITAVSRLGKQLRVIEEITASGQFAGVAKLLDDIGDVAAARAVVIPSAEIQALTQLTVEDVPDTDALSEFDDELEDSGSVFDWLVSCLVDSFAVSFDGVEDLLGGLGPDVGAGVLVPGVDPLADVGVHRTDGFVGAAA
jgi:hypothetical protein